ncbi:sensor domain-containing diguanylate cyclase [Rhizobium sp.]
MVRGAVFGKIPLEPADAREAARLAALEKLDVLDSPKDETLDRIARLIIQIFGVQTSVVSFIDSHRQWYMAAEGTAVREVPRKETFCRHTIGGTEPLVVRDASQDPRFADSPHVTARGGVRFYAGAPMRTRDGQNVGTVCAIGTAPRMFSAAEEMILTDLTQLAMDFIEMKRQATTDGLTGILNRRAFREDAERAISLATRHHESLAMIGFDLDHFKSINDTYGHKAGDEVLVAVTAAVRKELRSADIFGRVGGEEFAVVLPHTDREGVISVAEKLREAIAALEFGFNGKPVKVTASFGLCRLSLVTRDLDALTVNADAALYRAKAEGRNRHVIWEPTADSGQTIRRRVLKSGHILINERRSVIDCTIRSLGEDGAGLDVINSTSIPDSFDLAIRSDGFETRCRVMERTERHLEVTFSG